MEFYIWSFQHNAYWKPNRMGYTVDIFKAGRYSYEDAVVICIGANFYGSHGGIKPQIDEAMVPIEPPKA